MFNDDYSEVLRIPLWEVEGRNYWLPVLWKDKFQGAYSIPPPRIPGYAPKNGFHATSTNTAIRFIGVAGEYDDVEKIGQILFPDGEGHCYPNPEGGFPLVLEDRVLHVYQNRLNWDFFAETYSFDFLSALLYRLLTPEERKLYEFTSFPHRLGSSAHADFRYFFEAWVTRDPRLLQEMYAVVQKDWLRQRISILGHLLEPEILRSRSKSLRRFEF